MLFFIFPLSFIWGILLVWSYRPQWPLYFLWIFIIALLGLSYTFPPNMAFTFWLPGGLGCVAIGTVMILQFANFNQDKKEIIRLSLPSRKSIKEALTRTIDRVEKQKLYLKLVKEFSDKLKSQVVVLGRNNTFFLLALFFALFAIDYIFLQVCFSNHEELRMALVSSFDVATKKAPQGVEAEQWVALLDLTKRIFPSLLFIGNSILMIWWLKLLEFFSKRKESMPIAFGKLMFFRMPDFSIWLFILTGGAYVYLLKMGGSEIISQILLNALIITASLYVFQGLGIALLFLKVRLLPAVWLVSGFFIMGLVLPFFMMFFLMQLMLLGVLDFWFDFNKKALHPKILSKFER